MDSNYNGAIEEQSYSTILIFYITGLKSTSQKGSVKFLFNSAVTWEDVNIAILVFSGLGLEPLENDSGGVKVGAWKLNCHITLHNLLIFYS